MKLQLVIGHRSFTSLPTAEEIPGFLVITGANGAGKSQFLEAIRTSAIHGDWVPGVDTVVHLTSAELGHPSLTASTGQSRRMMIDNLKHHARQFFSPSGFERVDGLDEVYNMLFRELGLAEDAVHAAETRAGKSLRDWTHRDFENYTPFEFGQGLFDWSLADAFERYSSMRTVNDFNSWLEVQGKPHDGWLSDDDFVALNGPPPWELLNEALERVGLPYTFAEPSFDLVSQSYTPRLLSNAEGIEVSPDDLSSGEKTLVQIALSVYSGLHRSEMAKFPKVLLLDEPDATLHPSMVRAMLMLIEDVFVTQLGMYVFITTHSPTTVALAPEDALYVMERSEEQRLQKVSRDEALRRLLVGVPTISVSSEHRRVVFTESPIDVDCYTELFSVLRPHIASERTLTFIAAGKNKHEGNGCAAVIGMVDKLRQNGNLTVWGLVDRDSGTHKLNEWVLFNEERYAIENIVLDPLAVGLLLLSDGDPTTCASVPDSTIMRFRDEDAQTLADAVMEKVLPAESRGARRSAAYRNGTSLDIFEQWLDVRGHDLESLILDAIPRLKQYEQHHKFVPTIIRRVWAQDPGRIPTSVETTFLRLLGEA